MTDIRLALDWTPNTNHTGFFVAKTMGFYEDSDLNLIIQSPVSDDYSKTPAKKLEHRETDLAIAPTESLISYRTKSNPFRMCAIAALLQDDASAVAVLKSSGIERPKQLNGKSYASYGARYEDQIVKQMILNDGGHSDLRLHYPDKLGIWNTLVDGTCDATWIFKPWEGVEAEERGINLTTFKLGDFDIPYGYSPLLCAAEDQIKSGAETLASFLKATEKGFRFAIDNPAKAADLLSPELTEHDRNHIDLHESQRQVNPFYTANGTWGKMKSSVFRAFVDWLKQHELVPKTLNSDLLFTNKCL